MFRGGFGMRDAIHWGEAENERIREEISQRSSLCECVCSRPCSFIPYDGRGGMIVGFHGYAGKSISAIGIYVMSKSLAIYRNSTFADISLHQGGGTLGVSEGKLWDDGVFSSIKQVHVHVKNSANFICAVQFEYVKKYSTSVLSQMHGGACEYDKIEVVNLVGRDEYLTGISGFYGPIEGYNGMKGITSVAFYSNMKMYGPYGKDGGERYVYFASTTSPGKVIGFHGRKSDFLRAIGVHMNTRDLPLNFSMLALPTL
ncbi:hypothetical protein L1887_39034 [Cichorium endivia]|nr:hypothetical protein L1887_39034 [Cichorium endivia]